MKIVVAAIKNIQISVSNVHLCFEDRTSFRNNEFLFGASFSKLVFKTENATDSNEHEANDNMIDKTVQLEGLSIYFNLNEVCFII